MSDWEERMAARSKEHAEQRAAETRARVAAEARAEATKAASAEKVDAPPALAPHLNQRTPSVADGDQENVRDGAASDWKNLLFFLLFAVGLIVYVVPMALDEYETADATGEGLGQARLMLLITGGFTLFAVFLVVFLMGGLLLEWVPWLARPFRGLGRLVRILFVIGLVIVGLMVGTWLLDNAGCDGELVPLGHGEYECLGP